MSIPPILRFQFRRSRFPFRRTVAVHVPIEVKKRRTASFRCPVTIDDIDAIVRQNHIHQLGRAQA